MKDRPRYLLLAIINGVISFLTLATLERIQILRRELQHATEPSSGSISYTLIQHAFWTWPILVFHVVLFVVAALIVRRYLLNFVGSGLFFWLAVAALVCVAWFFAALAGIVIGPGNGVPIIERVLQAFIYRASQEMAINFVAAVFGVNFVFGIVVQLGGNHSWRGQPRLS